MSFLRTHWRKISTLAFLTTLGLAAGLEAHRLMSSGDCCQPGSPCCHPGSPCCHHASGAQASR